MISRFMAWLSEEAKDWKAVLGYVIFGALVIVSLDYAIEAALINWGLIPDPALTPPTHPYRYYNIFNFLTLFLWAPVKEEVLFRVLPLSVVIAFVSKTPKKVFGIMAAFAVLFGAIHPYDLLGNITIAIDGLFFGLVFLKCGGLADRYVKASLCAMATHGLTNVLAVLDTLWKYYELKT